MDESQYTPSLSVDSPKFLLENHKPQGTIDRTLLFITLMLTAMGVVVMLSASAGISLDKTGSLSTLWIRHLNRVAIGLVFLILFWRLDYHHLRWMSRLFLLVAFVLLVVVLFIHSGQSTDRFISILGFSFQPSEFARWVLVVFLAESLVRKREKLFELPGIIPFVSVIALIAGLVALQPSFSMAALIVLLGATMLFLGGIRLKFLLWAGALIVPALIAYMCTASYRMARISTFFNPQNDVQHHGYQRLQSLIALGRGGLVGVGPGNGRQKFFFLPEPYKDFIFSILGEEWGLIGTLLVVILFVVIFWRGMKVAKNAPDDFGRLLAAGMVFSLSYNALINIGVAAGILPTTGLPLPYLSYGGTSIMMFMASMGVLLNISKHIPSTEVSSE
jgi:cell division protein FtsW